MRHRLIRIWVNSAKPIRPAASSKGIIAGRINSRFGALAQYARPSDEAAPRVPKRNAASQQGERRRRRLAALYPSRSRNSR